VRDDEVAEYRKTVRWFVASAMVMLAGLALAVFEIA